MMKNPTTQFICHLGILLLLVGMNVYFFDKRDFGVGWNEFITMPWVINTIFCFSAGITLWRSYNAMKKNSLNLQYVLIFENINKFYKMKNSKTVFIMYASIFVLLIVITLYSFAKKDFNVSWDEFFPGPLFLNTVLSLSFGINSWRSYKAMKKVQP